MKGCIVLKKIISAVVCAALAVGMCGCGDKKSANADFKPGMDKNASASVEIIGKMDNFEALEAVIRDFNAVYPNVSVSYAKMDAYADNLPNLILGDNPPEIFMSYKSSFEQDSGLSDAVLDMNEIGLEKNVVDEGIMKACEYDGKSVRVPIMLNYQGIVANKTLLADAGLQIPKTYDEFTAACDALLAKGFTPIQGYSKTMYSSLLFNEWRCRLAKSENAAEIFDKINAGEDGCGDYFLDSFKILEDYRKKGYFSEDVNSAITDSYDAAILYFFEGKTPFLVCSSETVSGMKKRESKSDAFSAKPFEYEFASFLSQAEARKRLWIYGAAFLLPKTATMLNGQRNLCAFCLLPTSLTIWRS